MRGRSDGTTRSREICEISRTPRVDYEGGSRRGARGGTGRREDLEFQHPRPQRAGVHREDGGGAVGPVDPPARVFEDSEDVPALEVAQRQQLSRLAECCDGSSDALSDSRPRGAVGSVRSHPSGQRQRRAAAEQDRALDHVLQLTDVARPAVIPERVDGPLRDVVERAPDALCAQRRSAACASGSMSETRSRSGGIVTGKTFRR